MQVVHPPASGGPLGVVEHAKRKEQGAKRAKQPLETIGFSYNE
jgi:hypothetical protein